MYLMMFLLIILPLSPLLCYTIQSPSSQRSLSRVAEHILSTTATLSPCRLTCIWIPSIWTGFWLKHQKNLCWQHLLYMKQSLLICFTIKVLDLVIKIIKLPFHFLSNNVWIISVRHNFLEIISELLFLVRIKVNSVSIFLKFLLEKVV